MSLNESIKNLRMRKLHLILGLPVHRNSPWKTNEGTRVVGFPQICAGSVTERFVCVLRQSCLGHTNRCCCDAVSSFMSVYTTEGICCCVVSE